MSGRPGTSLWHAEVRVALFAEWHTIFQSVERSKVCGIFLCSICFFTGENHTFWTGSSVNVSTLAPWWVCVSFRGITARFFLWAVVREHSSRLWCPAVVSCSRPWVLLLLSYDVASANSQKIRCTTLRTSSNKRITSTRLWPSRSPEPIVCGFYLWGKLWTGSLHKYFTYFGGFAVACVYPCIRVYSCMLM